MTTQRQCDVEGCPKKVVARGWCNKHYTRWQNTGNPLLTIPEARALGVLSNDPEHVAHRERRTALGNAWQEANHDKVLAQRRVRRGPGNEYDRLYREANQEHIKAYNAEYRRTHQKEIKAYADSHKDQRRVAELQRHYNLSPDDYENLLIAQNYCCAICGSPDWPGRSTMPHVDHDHACCPEPARSCGKCVRGLLCGQCNMGLGSFNDSQEDLRSAIAYLDRWASACQEDDAA